MIDKAMALCANDVKKGLDIGEIPDLFARERDRP